MRNAVELGRIAKERRLERGLRQIDVVAKAREHFETDVISEPTYRAIELGKTAATDRVLAAASVGLDWPANGLQRIREGAEPAEITAEAQPDDDDPTDPGGASGEVAELREVVEAQGAELAELKQLLLDQNELLRAALSGRAEDLLNEDDDRGLGHRPQPPPMTGDEGA